MIKMKNMLTLAANEIAIINNIATHSPGIVILNVDNNEDSMGPVIKEIESVINSTVGVNHFAETFIVDRPHNKIDIIGTLPDVDPDDVVKCVHQIYNQTSHIITSLASYSVMCDANSYFV